MKRAKAGPMSGQAFTREMVNARRFWQRVAKGEGCWQWQGPRSAKSGYGFFAVKKFRDGPVHAHRVSYVLTHGGIPAGMCVMHACDNPPCVNPAHLRLGTHRENMLDAGTKGRMRNSAARLSHCTRGHLLPEPGANGFRTCRTCMTLSKARSRATQHVKAVTSGEAKCRAYFDEFIAPHLPASFAALCAIADARRAEIVARVFGCYGFAPCTAQTIATEWGLSRERVRQLRNHALKTLGVSEQVIREIPQHSIWKHELPTALAS